MATKTKTIKMLLYDGTLNGVMNISDSAWESGKMYSAPRESINDLVSRADCKKYGVYLLLSEQQVYVGQASDLERRTRQHLTDKDWWTQVILMTTKDDSFNASDIDYLESSLIDLAGKAGKSDSDNKKRGNPQKVDEFRQAKLEQYLEEALFLLELIGIRVFKPDTRKTRKVKSKPIAIETETPNHEDAIDYQGKPPLPDRSMKAGRFVKTAMENLSNAGYEFSDEMLHALCSEASMNKVVGMTRNPPFLKLYDPNDKAGHMIDGRPRFYSSPIAFGDVLVYLNSQIYESDKEAFIRWYEDLQ